MKVQLLMDLPVGKRHGMRKGRILDVYERVLGTGRGGVRVKVVGDLGELVGLLSHEFEYVPDGEVHDEQG